MVFVGRAALLVIGAFYANNNNVVCALRGIPRLDARTLDRSALATHLRDGPVILTDAIMVDSARLGGRLTLETWADELLQLAGGAPVEYQLREDGETELYPSNLADFCELAFESAHDSWVLLFDELLVGAHAAELRETLALRAELFEPDWFPLFPTELRPSGSCLIIGGEGARSTLHADPFEWVGTNVCLEGQKLWRFVPPSDRMHALLKSYRLPSIAWGSQGDALSAGWQSDFDLWARRRDDVPDAFALSEAEPSAADAQLDEMADMSSGLLEPSAALPAEVCEQTMGCVQRVGELVLIPPGWWHQTYYTGPSIGSAGQYLDSFCRDRVFQHVLDWTQTGARAEDIDASVSPREQIDALLALLQSRSAAGARGRGGSAAAGKLTSRRAGAGARARRRDGSTGSGRTGSAGS